MDALGLGSERVDDGGVDGVLAAPDAFPVAVFAAPQTEEVAVGALAVGAPPASAYAL